MWGIRVRVASRIGEGGYGACRRRWVWDLADSCVKLGGEGREVGIRGGRGEEVGENAEKTLRNRSSIPCKKKNKPF